METANEVTDKQLGYDTTILDTLYAFKQMRENYEPEGYINRRAYEGKHFTYWDRDMQELHEMPVKKVFFNQYPEVAKQTDAFENFLLSTELVFSIVPKLLSNTVSVTQAMYLSQLAKIFYDKFRESTTAPDFIHNALLDNVSFIEISPNLVDKTVDYRQFDFYDILFNPRILKWEDQTIVAKVVRKRVPDLKQSKLYTLPPDYTGYSAGAADYLSWKDIYEQEKYSQFAEMAKDETLIFEVHFLDKEKGLRIVTLDGAGLKIRDDKYPNIKTMDIQPFRVYSGSWYQKSYVARQIPINRSIDTLGSRFDDLILRLTKDGWLMQSEEDIDGEANEEMGQIWHYDAVKPEHIPMSQVPAFLPEWFSMDLSLSDRYGMSTLFSGGLPNKASGLRANKMIESLKGLTTQNNTGPINNYKAAIKNILRVTFLYLYEMWDTPKDVLSSELGQDVPQFISGKQSDIYNDEEKYIPIPNEFKKFDVDVDNGLGYTMEERKKTALELNKTKDSSGKPFLSDNAVRAIFKLGSTGWLMEADEKPLHQTEEFQKLINAYPNMSDEQKKALITTLGSLGGVMGNDPKAKGQIPLAGKTAAPPMIAPGQGTPTAAPPNPNPQPDITQPQGGGGQ